MNVITDLQSDISTLYKNKSDEFVKQFENVKKIIETSDDPKKDGIAI